jgi:hypothetical protein
MHREIVQGKKSGLSVIGPVFTLSGTITLPQARYYDIFIRKNIRSVVVEVDGL